MSQQLIDAIEAKKRAIASVKEDRADLEIHIEAMEMELDNINDDLDDLEHELAEMEQDLEAAGASDSSDVVLCEDDE